MTLLQLIPYIVPVRRSCHGCADMNYLIAAAIVLIVPSLFITLLALYKYSKRKEHGTFSDFVFNKSLIIYPISYVMLTLISGMTIFTLLVKFVYKLL